MSKIFKPLIFILIILVIFPALSYAGFLKFNATMPITGKVIDKDNNKPINNASLTFIWSEKGVFASNEKIQKTVLSGEDGSFKVSRRIFWGCPGLGSRILELEIIHPDYEKLTITIATLSFKDHYNWAYMVDVKKELTIYMISLKDK